ncbi:3-oxoacyl-[acyl-carrier protein] reductase (plasmid) [Ketogulonicigenium robustum]|uniref:3-oxoacyl-[acyl-carrier protein] reductase n=1 Tax=Ketogulonicigenium robustum TaxID=92947 RepID=A0A1W6P2Z6_9RHOB|nr:SDR family NAD(P)-dependent oxidoreductase [Ketogulonicigenium robustum]ARO15888.1 3-oxoacyl-[acyl-carrier protein] reductase [Ketogulonicigenium robustum]
MNTIDLNGKTAVVTGGAQGIGFAVAQRFIASGARVAIWDLDAARGADAVASLGEQAHFVRVDQADLGSVEAAAQATRDALGHVDILVANAGIAGSNGPTVDYDPAEFRKVIDVNLIGVFHVCRTLLPDMIAQGYGRVINVASIAGKEGNPNACAYSASKAGVIALTKTLGKETAALDIAVNCITPAAARTRIFEQMSQTHIDYMLSKIPRGRFLEVEEAANMVAWLASAENSFTTGAVFDLSGGRATY